MTSTPAESAELDRSLLELREGAVRWAALTVNDKALLLRRVRDRTARIAPRWVAHAANAKGITGTPLAGEEWLSGPWALLYALNRYIETLESIARNGGVRLDPKRIRTRRNGQVVVEVFPNDGWDRLLLSGVRAEVWMAPDVTVATLAQTLAPQYRELSPPAHVGLVLGAGNIASIPPLDALNILIAHCAVCMLKMNPVNEYLGPIFEDIFSPLIELGYLRIEYGGGDIGAYLCSHPDIDEIHITGSAATHDAILFGNGAEGTRRRRENAPQIAKPITSELGNVSPIIVLPGPWTNADFHFQAENIVTQKLHNNGFNCIAAQVLVLPSDWEGTPKLIAAIRRTLETLPDRPAYYPGAAARHAAALDSRAVHDDYGRSDNTFLSRSLVRVDANETTDPIYHTEAFTNVLAYTTIAGDTRAYLDRAVTFANDKLSGTLGANVIVHPKTERHNASALDAAIANLRYGCIGINAWTGVGFLIAQVPWGAYPGHTLADIGSGIGVVHNTGLFSNSQKSIVRAPFAPFPRSLFGYGAALLPKPPWFVTHRNAAAVGAALCRFEAHKGVVAAAKVAILAMGG